MIKWNKFDYKNSDTWPTKKGIYAVMIKGDSERDGAHVYYEFDDYQTMAILKDVSFDKDDIYISFEGVHDEQVETIFAWYGPIEIPKFDYDDH